MTARPTGRGLPPIIFAVCGGAVVAGLLEGALYSAETVTVVAAAGYTAMVAVPIAFVCSLALRGVVVAWRLPELIASVTEDSGSCPRLAAWVVTCGLSILALGCTTFAAAAYLLANSKGRPVQVLGTTAVVVAVAVLLFLLSRPLATGLTRLLRNFDARRRYKLVRPPVIVVASAAAVLAGIVVAWYSAVKPNVGYFDLGGFIYPATLIASLPAAYAALKIGGGRYPSGARFAGWASAVAVAVVVAMALFVRYRDPRQMLAIWADVPVAGFVIDAVYSVDDLRPQLILPDVAPEERPGAVHPDIILITIDTVRADHLSTYGGHANTAELDRLAGQGAVFEWAISPGNVTRRSLPTIATGVSPRRMRGRVVGWALKLEPRHVTVAERLRAVGYDTAGFFCCGSHFGKDRRLGLERGIDHLSIDANGAVLAAQAHAWIENRRSKKAQRPFFVWIHFIEPHNWLDQSPMPAQKDREPTRAYRERLYQTSLVTVDGFLGTVLQGIDAKKTLTIVSADHGEGMGDHGFPYHSTSLYNAQVRVPLVMAGPGIAQQKIGEPVGLVDLVPTMLDLAGFVPPAMPDVDGRSLAPVLRGEVEPRVDDGVARAVMVRDRSVGTSQDALIVGRYKLIRTDDGKIELYDLRTDRSERQNLAKAKPEIVREMEEHLKRVSAVDTVSPF